MSEDRDELLGVGELELIPDIDLGDPKYVRDRKRAARGHEAVRGRVLRNIMASVEGREWMHELLGHCHIYGNLFSSDALVMAANIGERNVGIKLIEEIQLFCPEMYLRMMAEAKDRLDVRD